MSLNETYVISNLRSRDLSTIQEEEYDSAVTEDEEEDEFEFSPKKAYIKNKWGKSAKHWSLWNAWDSSLLEFPPFVNGNVTTNIPYDVKTFINLAFKKHNLEDKGWIPLTNRFLVLRVILVEKYYPFTQQMKVDAHQLIFIDRQKTISTKTHHVKLLASAGLAEIFQAVIKKSDILIISGGYDLTQTKDLNKAVQYSLNFNKEHQTQIIRIPATLHGRLTLYEKIEPLKEEKQFKFTYMVKRGTYQRTVQQYRRFDQDEFCRKVTDTLAYSRVRWDFPVPIVGSGEAFSLYELLCFRGFQIPTTPFKSAINYDEPIDHSFKKYSPTKKDKVEYLQTSQVFKSYTQKKEETKQSAKTRGGSKTGTNVTCGCGTHTFLVMLTLALLVFVVFFVVNLLSDVCPLVLNKKLSQEDVNDDFPLTGQHTSLESGVFT